MLIKTRKYTFIIICAMCVTVILIHSIFAKSGFFNFYIIKDDLITKQHHLCELKEKLNLMERQIRLMKEEDLDLIYEMIGIVLRYHNKKAKKIQIADIKKKNYFK